MSWAKRLYNLIRSEGEPMNGGPWAKKLYEFFLANGLPENANQINYSNSISARSSTDVQGALDELSEEIDLISSLNTSGAYQPTISDGVNLTSITASIAQYFRVNDTVTVFGSFTADATLALATSFEMTLPISTVSTSPNTLDGSAANGLTVEVAAIVGTGAPNHRAKVQWVASDLLAREWAYSFTYLIQ